MNRNSHVGEDKWPFVKDLEPQGGLALSGADGNTFLEQGGRQGVPVCCVSPLTLTVLLVVSYLLPIWFQTCANSWGMHVNICFQQSWSFSRMYFKFHIFGKQRLKDRTLPFWEEIEKKLSWKIYRLGVPISLEDYESEHKTNEQNKTQFHILVLEFTWELMPGHKELWFLVSQN